VLVKAAVADLNGNLLGSDAVFAFRIGLAVDLGKLYLPLARR
jgi:hypothetical protein